MLILSKGTQKKKKVVLLQHNGSLSLCKQVGFCLSGQMHIILKTGKYAILIFNIWIDRNTSTTRQLCQMARPHLPVGDISTRRQGLLAWGWVVAGINSGIHPARYSSIWQHMAISLCQVYWIYISCYLILRGI